MCVREREREKERYYVCSRRNRIKINNLKTNFSLDCNFPLIFTEKHGDATATDISCHNLHIEEQNPSRLGVFKI